MPAGQPRDVLPLLAYCFSEASGLFKHLASATQSYSVTGRVPQSAFRTNQDHESQSEEETESVGGLTERRVAPLAVDRHNPVSRKTSMRRGPKKGQASAFQHFIRERSQQLRDASKPGEKINLLARGRQDWKELSKAEKMEYAKKYKAEHGQGETDGDEMEQQNGENPSAGPSGPQSPAHAGPGSLAAEEGAAPEDEAARDTEGLAVQLKRDASKKGKKRKNKSKRPLEDVLPAGDASAEGAAGQHETTGTAPAGEAPDGEAPASERPNDEKKKKKKKKKKTAENLEPAHE